MCVQYKPNHHIVMIDVSINLIMMALSFAIVVEIFQYKLANKPPNQLPN